jgi:choline dehydrogenase-like flavoprotein
MIVDSKSLINDDTLEADAIIIGAGPAGIVIALEVARGGAEVLLIESGLETYSERIQNLADAADFDHELHAPMSMATRRQFGGTSIIWGGRCVPYDPIDFDARPFICDAAWPVSYDELLVYYERACTWMACGRPIFDANSISHLAKTLVPGLVDGYVRSTNLERWSLPTDFGREYRQQMEKSSNVRLVTGLTCTEIVCVPGDSRVDHLVCRTLDGAVFQARGKQFVVAAGGLESTRLLLASKGPNGTAIGNHSDHLGRWYMGHLEGVISNVRFSTPPRLTQFDYERDIDGVYVRRRLSFSREFQHVRQLPNIVAWLANPELADPVHASGILSFVYLALLSPVGKYFAPDAQRRSLIGERVPGSPYGGAHQGPICKHLMNIVRQPIVTLRFMVGFGMRRFVPRRRSPGFFVYSQENVYPLQYHGEHRPDPESRVTLSDERDELGMPKIRINIRFSDDDIEGVLAAHRCWDEYLRATGCGSIEYLHTDLAEEVRSRAGGGFHQIGTTRMAMNADDGVVDENLAVHGIENLFVASSSTFVTSGQANSTFLIVVLAIRLADLLRRLDATPTDSEW